MREKNRSRASESPLRAWSRSCVISPIRDHHKEGREAFDRRVSSATALGGALRGLRFGLAAGFGRPRCRLLACSLARSLAGALLRFGRGRRFLVGLFDRFHRRRLFILVLVLVRFRLGLGGFL